MPDEPFCQRKKKNASIMTRTIAWLLLVIHFLNEINSTTGHFSAVKTPRFKRAGANSPAEDYGSSFYGPDNPPNLLYDNQQLQPQIQEPTVNFTIDHSMLTVGHQNSQPITTIGHQMKPIVNFTIDRPTLTGGHRNSQQITTIGHQMQPTVNFTIDRPTLTGDHRNPQQITTIGHQMQPTVNFTIDRPTLTVGHQNSQPITTIGHQLQSQVQRQQHELVFGQHPWGHEYSHPQRLVSFHQLQAGASAVNNQIHSQHSVPFQFQAEAVTEEKKTGAKKVANNRSRRAIIRDALHKLRRLIGKKLSIRDTLFAACELVNELCLKLRQWKSRDAQVQEEQKCFHQNLQILYDELAKHSIDKKLWPNFNQPPLPPLISSDVDIYMSTVSVDLNRFRDMPEATDDDDDDDDDINEPMETQNQQVRTAHVREERRRRLNENNLLVVLYKMIPLTAETLGIKNNFDKITAAANYIQKLKSLQKEHENAELYYAKLFEDFAQHMNVIENFFFERGVPMPALSDCDRKGKRVKIGHEHQSSPRNNNSSSGNSGDKGVQPQMMGLSVDDHFLHATMADDHFLRAAMASSSHHPHGLMPFGEASSSQHPQPLHHIPMQGMESGRYESGHGLHGHWPDFASNSGDDDMHLLYNPTLFDMMRSTSEKNPIAVELLKKAVLEHKIEKTQLQDIICHQKTLIEEQNELGGIVVKNLMTTITKLNNFLHESGIKIHNCDLLPAVVDPLPEDGKRKQPMEGQISLIDETVNLADLALRVTFWPTLPNAIEHEKLIVSRGLLLMDEFLVTCVHKLNCFLLFRSRPILQLITEVRQRIKTFKLVRLKTANTLEKLLEEAEKEIGSLRQQMADINAVASYLKHLEPMWNLRFYEHIYKGILNRMRPSTFAEGNVTTGNEGRMLANARRFLEMAIRQIAEDLNIFDDPNHIKEKLAQKRYQCDRK